MDTDRFTKVTVRKTAEVGTSVDILNSIKNIGERISHRFIYCSSPDRGLEELLNLWPLIKKKLPDAELKIFYGWDYFNSRLGIPAYREYKERIRQLIKQDGVEWCGRVGQEQLAEELMKSDAMVYRNGCQARTDSISNCQDA